MRAEVYLVSDPTSDTLTSLGFVTDAGVVYRPGETEAAVIGQVLLDGTVIEGAERRSTPIGHVTEDGLIYRGDRHAPALAGHVTRDGAVYRGKQASPLGLAGYVSPHATRAQMGGAALLLGLLD